ncbi:uncharacterized protein LOC129719971 [Wyeomyia smithii]|uniref:uncharacterized protein LOC129719971 n=1 Tax=Wyeomyia smithii TaxID=174621 RepID=UPI002467B26F|nr:uncharacterized protein LOC129719971 [Wyeomyia smithii]
MTFGACCSPSSAQFAKNLNAERFKPEFPTAYEAITKSHYVDDMLISVASEEEAIRVAKDVKHVHAQGGFEIRNWLSNSRAVTTALHEERQVEKCLDLSSELSAEKVLGMWWNTTLDFFTFKIGWTRYDATLLKGTKRPTKRGVLRILMSIYDPLGLIAHFLSYLKFLLQEIWRSGVDWDEEINDDAVTKWQGWLNVLPQVENVKIARCYFPSFPVSEADEIQLHTLVDAGKNGMAAVSFLRTIKDGKIHCSLVASKTKVAPLKLTSVPRLELHAAVIGTRLSLTLLDTLSIGITKKFYWSDSRDVLCWINSDHRRYSQFVGFKVTEILEATEASEWRYVPSKLNVADDATKWAGCPDLSAESRWLNGPDFLWTTTDAWPQISIRNDSTNVELTANCLIHCTIPEPFIKVENFSSWNHLKRVSAWVLRFPTNCRSKRRKEPMLTRELTKRELCCAETHLLLIAQRVGYPQEWFALCNATKSDRALVKSSPLYKLMPCLDENGLMRMRTRIGACQFATNDAKKPIILPRKHHITALIVSHYHEKYHHHYHETVINEIRQKFQISRLRPCYFQARRNCQRCKNDQTSPKPPIMADLPPGRLAAFSRPFTHVGIDYFGPIEVVVGRRVEKRWGTLATCLTVRAIHIEIVHSLTTSSCIMAIQNFIARRGQPRNIYSDRGTNFVGAQRELQQLNESIDHDLIMREFTNTETEWVFNPPQAPHMGGSWERLIRAVKVNMMTVIATKRPREIENTVNSRPLTHVPVDDDSGPALTPNHFLLGSSNGVKPLVTLDSSGRVLKQNWCCSQIIANQFWKRWVNDYLPEITRRSKWFHPVKPIVAGDVVVIVDPKLPRNCWPKGKIISATPSRDGQVRVATVRTANGVYQRPVTQLAVLDVQRVE